MYKRQLFTGRYIEIHVFPFSFQEYCQYYDDVSDKDKLFDDYTIKGGLAGSYAYRTEKDRTNYIKEVYETIVTRDLVQKYALPDTLVLQRLSEFLMDNISIILAIFLEAERKHMNFNIASGKQSCQICTQQESIRACYIAVSYTHLDVYKRQVYPCSSQTEQCR